MPNGQTKSDFIRTSESILCLPITECSNTTKHAAISEQCRMKPTSEQRKQNNKRLIDYTKQRRNDMPGRAFVGHISKPLNKPMIRDHFINKEISTLRKGDGDLDQEVVKFVLKIPLTRRIPPEEKASKRENLLKLARKASNGDERHMRGSFRNPKMSRSPSQTSDDVEQGNTLVRRSPSARVA